MHFGFHLLYEGDAQAITHFSKPFIWFGLGAIIDSGDSGNHKQQLLYSKTRRQKLGNEFIASLYAAAALLIYHQAIAGKGTLDIARWFAVFAFIFAPENIARSNKTPRADVRRARTTVTISATVAMYFRRSRGMAQARPHIFHEYP